MNALLRFMRTGELGAAVPGTDYRDIVAAWGEPDGLASEDPVFCLYGDVQLGFSAEGSLTHIAVEPDGDTVSVPGDGDTFSDERVPRLSEALSRLAEDGYGATKCAPFVPDETWWRIDRSGVLVPDDPDDRLTAIHRTLP
ncbi:hypothetical protein ACQEVX_21780 [Streptomyces syringium]|uniref:hypothetical protein n=1 Tax=Streptomyces syringium TaxID=76729 RepID=UPI0010152323|nr:hypothetical protein SNS2_3323 [Streptomyces netropsis]